MKIHLYLGTIKMWDSKMNIRGAKELKQVDFE